MGVGLDDIFEDKLAPNDHKMIKQYNYWLMEF
jgi:hypothetical protein